MKGVFVILDGVADEPCGILGNKTPLECAKTPNLDWLASKSKLGHCFPIAEGIAPQSSSGIVSLFGEDYKKASRGILEAVGAGITLNEGDLALRCNFATIDNLKDFNLIDRRAGRTLTTKEARILEKSINEKVKLPYKFKFISTIGHRAVLIFRGVFSDNISNIDPDYEDGVSVKTYDKIRLSYPYDDSSESSLTANLVNTFVQKSFVVLENHPINLERKKKGIYPANFILCRDSGSKKLNFKKLDGKWCCFGYMPLEIGFGLSFNMDVKSFKYPEFKDMDSYQNLDDALSLAIKHSKKLLNTFYKNYDYFYIHFKETDLPGHDNKPLEKVKMIELLDKEFFSFLKKFIEDKSLKILVTSDHTTSCRAKRHTDKPVPVLFYDSIVKKNEKNRFTEPSGNKGKQYIAKNLLKETIYS
jgi:2,3-bisphosphoglycerate-independent phosphoglycerate mutase